MDTNECCAIAHISRLPPRCGFDPRLPVGLIYFRQKE